MKQILWFIKTYVTFVVLFVAQKPLFLLTEKSFASQPTDNIWAELPSVMWHGLPLDLAMAGYLSALPGLLLISMIWLRKSMVRPVLNTYFVFAALLGSLSLVLNLGLYPYWSFPLDSTPLYYFFTSPADALASVSLWHVFLLLLAVTVSTVAGWFALRMPADKKQRRSRYSNYGFGDFGGGRRTSYSDDFDRHPLIHSLVLLILTASLFIPIRGGFTVGTNNTGKAYFSDNAFLNHAGVNPLFSLFESLLHQNNFAEQYRFMSDEEASKLFAQMVSTSDHNTYPLLNEETRKNGKPDILIVIMESFANDLLPSIGSQGNVAVCLDSIARTGIFFPRFYANSFRTDRGLVSILSGYPAQPTTSIMREPAKAAHLPSLARSLAEAKHYGNTYYYGGDIDFAHQRSYLFSQGFQKIISDADFPIKERTSKWGAHDHVVANRLLADLKKEQHLKQPMFRVFQTSSSHEPYDVPYSRLADKRLNSFAYTDSVIGSLLREYSKLPSWRNTLVVLVPDHVGTYKDHLSYFERSRYQIPLILTGGAISRPMNVKLIGSQHDIAATLLGQLGIPHEEFLFSKNMMSDATPKFAFFDVPDAFGVVSEENSIIYDNQSKRVMYDKGKKGYNLKRGMAYLQKLYDDLSKK